jgi:hypothetical protein
MSDIDPAKRAQAMAVFKLAAKASSKAVHRTLNRPAKGKGWVQCANMPAGIVCRPDQVRESIELFRKGYAIFPDIVALNQIALHYEMLGEAQAAKEYFSLMKAQAERESNPVYARAAELGLARIG